jgi:hypothetical protein
MLTTPYYGYLKNALIAATGRWDCHHGPLLVGGHIKFWSKRTITNLFEESGFTIRQWKGLGRLPYLWANMFVEAEV